MTRGRRIGWIIGGVVVVVALGLGARTATGVLVSASNDIPTGTVTRGTLKAGQEADVEVQAVGNRAVPARITGFSALAKVEFGPIWPPPRLFDVQLDLATPNPAMRPGMTAAIKIRRDKVADALLVPTRALFPPTSRTSVSGAASGTPAEVFVLGSRGFERRSVRVARRGPDTSATADGLRPGERIALERPEEIDEP